MLGKNGAGHSDKTLALLDQILTQYDRVLLCYSGGKDSTTLLHLLRPWAAHVEVLHVALDGGFPGVLEYVKQCCDAWGFRHLTLLAPAISLPAYIARYGWPVHLVPTAMDGVLPDPWYDGGPKVASFWHCTALRIMAPLYLHARERQADVLLTGSRRSDAPYFHRQGPVLERPGDPEVPWIRYNPLHDWSTADIWQYLDAYGITLPPHYAWKRHVPFEAPDCKLCPYSPSYVAWLKQHDPDTFHQLWQVFRPTLERQMHLAQQEVLAWLGLLAPARDEAHDPLPQRAPGRHGDTATLTGPGVTAHRVTDRTSVTPP